MTSVIDHAKTYCNSLTEYSRLLTREVKIGDVALGGINPIRIQSMTTTDTMDTEATIAQSIRIIEAGADYVRITAPSMKEAQNLELIKKGIREKGFDAPLIADIHYTPNAAELAARIVEKVRVNPGNYADKKKFAVREYSDAQYNEELDRIRAKFLPLIGLCKEYGTAMRIGTNHGSLSDRIMNRYGDTPLGMVESAMEFVRFCEDENYHEIVLSMKASNTKVMVEAYRLLVHTMLEEGRIYPIHLGVTEAGEAEDGRIKSSVGIGALLEDGIGDTVRVSLTEEPEIEIPVAQSLVDRYKNRNSHRAIPAIEENPIDPFEFNRRPTEKALNIGGSNVPVVVADMSDFTKISEDSLKGLGYSYSASLDKWNLSDQACDYIYLGNNNIDFKIPGTLGLICNAKAWMSTENKDRCYPLFCGDEFFETNDKSETLNFVLVDTNILTLEFITEIKTENNVVFVFDTNNEHGMAEQRRMFMELITNGCNFPVILRREYRSKMEDTMLYSSTDFGTLLLDGLGAGIWTSRETPTLKDLASLNATQFGILQATRTRISKTEYISCPSCGRTLFDLQETTAKIRARTHHLKGVKIGIMGCIVNGPGEMADADYGYVGTGPGKITLYKGREVVERNVPSEQAVESLINLIKEHGDWVDEAS